MIEYRDLIDELISDYDSKKIWLSGWEVDFLESLMDKEELTIAQKEKLLEIYDGKASLR